MVVLGRPDVSHLWKQLPDPSAERRRALMVAGLLVVLVPDGTLHGGGGVFIWNPETHPSRPLFIAPWDRGWLPLPPSPSQEGQGSAE
jgi:hypothetical protein